MKSSSERFTECWHADGPRVLAYARRHVGPEHAPDVVADTFMVAWRRWDDVPDPPIAWLIATARGVVRNRRRSLARQHALASRITLIRQVAAEDSTNTVLQRQEALRRLGDLTEQHREALLLTSWDGLSAQEAADALGIKPAAFRRRLSRARASLVEEPAPLPPLDPYLTRALIPKETS